ncbi:hypothetical protein DER46DRAFT_645017 [Fusarium sp. MPI-SDFR-AT-0072]|nr:hypothetical protein DER46DRAFT_645017 [Fusarium sp. MPI-SDFR-AT-0072]
MSDPRDLAEDARVLAKIYSTQFYRRVEHLAKNASGVVYDPSRGPAPTSPELKPFQPAPPRPDTPDRPPLQGSTYPAEQSSTRTLKQTSSGLGEMTMDLTKFVRNKPRRGRMNTMWDVRQIQTFARLSVWGVHKDVIEGLIGWPREWFTCEEAPIYYATIEDELRYIPVTPQQAEADDQQSQSSGRHARGCYCDELASFSNMNFASIAILPLFLEENQGMNSQVATSPNQAIAVQHEHTGLGRVWNIRELEKAARLSAWKVPNFVKHAILGTPSAEPHGEDFEVFKRWQKEEEDMLAEIHGLGGFAGFRYGQQGNRPQGERPERVGNITQNPYNTGVNPLAHIYGLGNGQQGNRPLGERSERIGNSTRDLYETEEDEKDE